MQLLWQQHFSNDGPDEQNKCKELVTEVLPEFVVQYIKMMKAKETLDAVSTCKTVLLTVGDSASDVYALVVLLMATSRYAISMAISLAIANVVQALAAYFWQREGPVVTGAALFGLKPQEMVDLELLTPRAGVEFDEAVRRKNEEEGGGKGKRKKKATTTSLSSAARFHHQSPNALPSRPPDQRDAATRPKRQDNTMKVVTTTIKEVLV